MTSNEIEQVKLDLDKVRVNIPNYSSEKLCEMIVCDRYFSISPEITVMCMEQLAARRMAGDSFAFEAYIEEAYSRLPPLNFNMPDLRTILSKLTKVDK